MLRGDHAGEEDQDSGVVRADLQDEITTRARPLVPSMPTNDDIRLTVEGNFFALEIPYHRKEAVAFADRILHGRWIRHRHAFLFPACRECLLALLRAFPEVASTGPGVPNDFPPLARWMAAHGYASKTLFPVGTTAVVTRRQAKHYGELCAIENVVVTEEGRLRYSVSFGDNSHGVLDEASLGNARDYIVIGRRAHVTDRQQLEIEWSSRPHSEPTRTEVAVTPFLLDAEQELIEYFAAKPERMTRINPALFERLVLAIYKNHGFEVEQIGNWNQADGGVDIIAVQKSVTLGELRLAIQCKQSRDNISARPIRELHGVLDRFRAHMGVLCTTAWFTRHAVRETQNHLWRVSLQDRAAIYEKLRGIVVVE